MLKKLISIFVFSVAIVPLVVIPACEDWLTYEVTICDVELIAEPNANFWTEPDSVVRMTGDIAFVALGEQGLETCWAPSLPIVNTAYATTPCARFANSFQQSTFNLSFDREFGFENESIPANTNLLAHPAIAAQIEAVINSDCDGYFCTFFFPTALQNALTFETGEYVVSFSCETSDEKQLSDSVRVIFRL